MILEKACAKLHGSYEALAGKRTDHWLSLFTSSFLHKIVLSDPCVKRDAEDWGLYVLMEMMCEWNKRTANPEKHVHIWCAVRGKHGEHNRSKSAGLEANIAYSVTEVKLKRGDRPTLLRIKYPLEKGRYWGPWSSSQDGGNTRDRQSEGRDGWGMHTSDGSRKADGHFWIPVQDLTPTPTSGTLCRT